LFQHFAFQFATITALRQATHLDRDQAKVLDVGCGNGASLLQLMQLGFRAENLHGIDIISERLERARSQHPTSKFHRGDASAMPYESETFDLTMESTMFVQVTNEGVARCIAGEMLRVTKKNGYILLIDWRYGKPGNKNYSAVSQRRLNELFSLESHATVVCRERGALVPPIGRTLSKHLPAFYFLIRSLFPFLVGSTATLLRKNP
jgi:ubiquinone/menaquinone biosynthesis C-methylase UbiE